MVRYRATNISSGITSKSNRNYRNIVCDFAYRKGQRWTTVRLSPGQSMEFEAHELNLKAKTLIKFGALSVEDLAQEIQAVQKIEKVEAIIEKLPEVADSMMEAMMEEVESLQAIIEETVSHDDKADEDDSNDGKKKTPKAKLRGKKMSDTEGE